MVIPTSALTLKGYQEYPLSKNERMMVKAMKDKELNYIYILFVLSSPLKDDWKKSNKNVIIGLGKEKWVFQSSELVETRLSHWLNHSAPTTCHPSSRAQIKNAWFSQASWIINIFPSVLPARATSNKTHTGDELLSSDGVKWFSCGCPSADHPGGASPVDQVPGTCRLPPSWAFRASPTSEA